MADAGSAGLHSRKLIMSRDKELASRRSTFRGGVGIRLADGQFWNLPGPAAVAPRAEAESHYPDLLLALREADEEADRGLAVLALMIFLLNLNYDLDSAETRELLTFEPGSEALLDWRRESRAIAASHVEFQRRARSSPNSAVLGGRSAGPSRLFSRWFSWLRTPAPARR